MSSMFWQRRFIPGLFAFVMLLGCESEDGRNDSDSATSGKPTSAADEPQTTDPSEDIPDEMTEPATVDMPGAPEPTEGDPGQVTAEMDPMLIPKDGVPQDASSSSSPRSESRIVIRREGQTTEHRGYSAERVYFATNRAPEQIPEAIKDPDLYYSGERGELRYGVCEVSIPYRRQPGELPEPSLLRLEFSQDPSRHVVLMEISELPDAAFWLDVRSRVEASADKQLFVFVHGYCATFRDAARRTAQIAYDLNYQGPSMFFSWPAGSDVESFTDRANYLKDLRRAEQSDDDLITVLEGISRFSGATKIHLVAHSMGNFVLSEALKTLDDRRGASPVPALFDQVAMAAPDLDAREFVERVAARIRPFSQRLTVYASAGDKALGVSRSVNDYEPLGYLNDFTRTGARQQLFDLVDASQLTNGWFDSGHVYYGDMPEVLRDFGFVFHGVQASSLQRGLAETPPVFRLMAR